MEVAMFISYLLINKTSEKFSESRQQSLKYSLSMFTRHHLLGRYLIYQVSFMHLWWFCKHMQVSWTHSFAQSHENESLLSMANVSCSIFANRRWVTRRTSMPAYRERIRHGGAGSSHQDSAFPFFAQKILILMLFVRALYRYRMSDVLISWKALLRHPRSTFPCIILKVSARDLPHDTQNS